MLQLVRIFSKHVQWLHDLEAQTNRNTLVEHSGTEEVIYQAFSVYINSGFLWLHVHVLRTHFQLECIVCAAEFVFWLSHTPKECNSCTAGVLIIPPCRQIAILHRAEEKGKKKVA